jgi:UDP-N-acetylglucosamine 1-carboxyvinyltransferase
MKCYRVEGGRALKGSIEVSGSKNAVLPCLAAALLTSGTVVLKNVPMIRDVDVMVEILKALGAEVSISKEEHKITVKVDEVHTFEIPETLSKLLRASTLFMGPMLARAGRVRLYGYGGCPIGKRPIDLHLKAFKSLGAVVEESTEYIEIKAERLKGSKIELSFPSVGATENALMAAALADGETEILNIAIEPEVLDLASMLRKMGARIEIDARKRVARVWGVEALSGAEHSVIPDRIEAGTYMVSALVTDGELELRNVEPMHLENVIGVLREMGAEVEVVSGKSIRVVSEPTYLKPTNIVTEPYPGFPTDLQPQFTVLLAVKSSGTSTIRETIYEERFHHVNELRKMGAEVFVEGRTITIHGPRRLAGSVVEARDLRGGAALLLAGLAAEGATIVRNAEHVERGYENMVGKLNKVGARIEITEE